MTDGGSGGPAAPSSQASLTGLVLAGGQSRRLGRDKAEIPWPPGSRATLLEHIVAILEPLCREVIVVGRSPPRRHWVLDPHPARGPLQGLAAGLRAMRTPWALAAACDLPLLRPSLVSGLWSRAAGDAVIPQVGGRLQPLLALYRRSCLPAVESALDRGERRMGSFWRGLDVRVLKEELVRPYDPELLSFRNVNTLSELRGVAALWRTLQAAGGDGSAS